MRIAGSIFGSSLAICETSASTVRPISNVVVSNSWEYPVSRPRAVTGNSVQQSKAGDERVPDAASESPKFQVTTAEQLSVVGVGTSQKGVGEFRKFFELPHGDLKRRHEEGPDKVLHGELPKSTKDGFHLPL